MHVQGVHESSTVGSPVSMEVNMPMTLTTTVLCVMLVFTLDATSHLHGSRYALRKLSAVFEGLSALILHGS